MVCHLLSQKATKLTHFNLKNIDPIWKNEDDEKIGSVYKSAKKYIKYNNEKIEKIEFYMKLVYNFSWLSLISFIVFIIISIKFIAF